MMGNNTFLCQYLLRTVTGHTERASPYNTLLVRSLCLSILVSLQFTFFQRVIFSQQSIELQHLRTQFEYLNSLCSLFNLAEGFSGECLKFSIWGRAGDAAAPSAQGSAFGALLLPSAGSAAALILLIPPGTQQSQPRGRTSLHLRQLPNILTVTPCVSDLPQ